MLQGMRTHVAAGSVCPVLSRSVHAPLERAGNDLVLGAARPGRWGGTAQTHVCTSDSAVREVLATSASSSIPPPQRQVHARMHARRRTPSTKRHATHMTYTTAPQPARQSRSCPLSSAWLTVSNSSSGPCSTAARYGTQYSTERRFSKATTGAPTFNFQHTQTAPPAAPQPPPHQVWPPEALANAEQRVGGQPVQPSQPACFIQPAGLGGEAQVHTCASLIVRTHL